PNVSVENPFGAMGISANTFIHAGNGIDSTATAQLSGNIFQGPPPGNQLNALSPGSSKPEAACNDFGSGAFVSKGYNISTDASCSLNQVSDQPNTDPLLSLNQNGLPILNPGSPAIDAGSDSVLVFDGEDMAVLPCGYMDINGMARPQDGDGNGGFECDTGASEFLGTGSMQAGHSGAFYNALRNGEGNYVEMLSDNVAVVYTFTFRPDGSGPSWFIGVGDIRANSIVIEDLLRPTGTSFGSGFDPDAIDYSDAGGMSMIFPTCDAGGGGGGVAYSGNPELGYEGLLSRAQRITSITGCNNTPTANAGLSGSFYDPARNGEGLIVEWLTNGDVVAIFFNYDQNGDQFWTFGIGTASGKSVTINALYPAASTVWGRNFNPGDVDLQPWGTFNLTWTACDSLDFDYNSTVPGYGSGSYDYTRVSTLQSTTCPSF
ncbi:MAG: choice-of-anchor Q domain-containing protein, partial [Lysobacterales bacterium]